MQRRSISIQAGSSEELLKARIENAQLPCVIVDWNMEKQKESQKQEMIVRVCERNDVYGNKRKTLLESFISGTDKHSWLITVFGIPFGKFVTVRFQFLVTWQLRWIGRVSGPECGILVLIHTPFHSTLKPPDQVVEIPTSCSESCIVNDEKHADLSQKKTSIFILIRNN